MKKFFIIACTLLLFVISVKAAPATFPKENNYWVTETGPRSNPYTVIRLYDEAHNLLSEILMSGYRLKTKPAMIKRLNRLANTVNADDAASIAAILRVDECRVSSVQRNQQSTYCINQVNY